MSTTRSSPCQRTASQSATRTFGKCARAIFRFRDVRKSEADDGDEEVGPEHPADKDDQREETPRGPGCHERRAADRVGDLRPLIQSRSDEDRHDRIPEVVEAIRVDLVR